MKKAFSFVAVYRKWNGFKFKYVCEGIDGCISNSESIPRPLGDAFLFVHNIISYSLLFEVLNPFYSLFLPLYLLWNNVACDALQYIYTHLFSLWKQTPTTGILREVKCTENNVSVFYRKIRRNILNEGWNFTRMKQKNCSIFKKNI